MGNAACCAPRNRQLGPAVGAVGPVGAAYTTRPGAFQDSVRQYGPAGAHGPPGMSMRQPAAVHHQSGSLAGWNGMQAAPAVLPPAPSAGTPKEDVRLVLPERAPAVRYVLPGDSTVSDADFDWLLKEERNFKDWEEVHTVGVDDTIGIQLFKKNDKLTNLHKRDHHKAKTRKVFQFKLYASLKNCRPANIFDLIDDVEVRQEWDKLIEELRLLDLCNGDTKEAMKHQLLYAAIRSPGGTLNRDFVYHSAVRIDPNRDVSVIINKRAVDTDTACPPKRTHVRGECVLTGYVIRPDPEVAANTRLTVYLDVDLNENVLLTLVDSFALKGAVKWVRSLERAHHLHFGNNKVKECKESRRMRYMELFHPVRVDTKRAYPPIPSQGPGAMGSSLALGFSAQHAGLGGAPARPFAGGGGYMAQQARQRMSMPGAVPPRVSGPVGNERVGQGATVLPAGSYRPGSTGTSFSQAHVQTHLPPPTRGAPVM